MSDAAKIAVGGSEAQQVLGDAACDVPVVGAGAEILRTYREPGRRERALVAFGSVAARVEAELVGRLVADERDPAMAEVEEVPGCELAAEDVVDHDVRQDRARRVDEDARDVSGLEPGQLLGRRDERDDQEAVGPVAVAEHLEGAALAVGGLDVEERQVVGRAVEGRDDAPDALDRRRAREERDDHADHERPAEREVSGDGARAIIEVPHRVEDALARRRRDGGAAVQDARDGRNAHPGPGGDVDHPGRNPWNRFHLGHTLPPANISRQAESLTFTGDRA